MDNDDDSAKTGQYLDTVRALHQTVVSLRTALEESRGEILELKTKTWPLQSLQAAISALSIENHLLRRKIIERNNKNDKINRTEIDGELEISEKVLSAKVLGRELLTETVLSDLIKQAKDLDNNVEVKVEELGLKGLSEVGDISEIKQGSKQSSEVQQGIKLKSQVDKESGNKTKGFDSEATKVSRKRSEVLKKVGDQVTEGLVQKDYLDKSIEAEDSSKVELKSEKRKVFFGQSDIDVFSEHTLENRFRKIASSLENISTTKSQEKSSNFLDKTRSYQNLSQIGDFENVFAFKTFENGIKVKKSEKKQKKRSKPQKELFSTKLENGQASKGLESRERKTSNQNDIDGLEEFKIKKSKKTPKKSRKVEESEAKENKNVHIDVSTKKNNACTGVDKTADLNTNVQNKSLSLSINLDIFRKHPKSVIKMEEKEVVKNGKPEAKENVLQHSSSTDLLDQEVDDIELIFTNEDTKETNLKEPLISIEGECQNPGHFDQNLSADVSDRELEDDVFNDNFENENQENSNFQSQTFDFTRENSMYNSKSDNSINREEMKSLKSCYSYQDSSFENKSLEKDESFDRFEERIRIVETDMSKVGIQDVEYSAGRRNTCPNPLQYRPIIHREAIGRGTNSRKARPILVHSNAIRKESGAQTDISALPSNSAWRSESSLAHKVKMGENFTTLPSKYPMPGSRLRLSEKTVEARRILLSDIGFTSMVPELSRSADHLCPPHLKTTNYGQFLKTTDLYSPGFTSQKFVWTTASPSDSHSHSRYSSLYPLQSTPAPSRRCSAPVSPSRKNVLKHVPSRVRFANGSLPELRGDWNSTIDSGDSTDSLVEEAEQYLRRSIDCIVSGKDATYYSTPKSGVRRASAPEPSRDNVPPQGWQPFLPRLPRDLRLDYWVKVISPEGRVRGGRVRYIGHLLSQSEQFVGVQLSSPEGHSDGTYNNRRYFQCEPYHGIFVPFKKVIMGWRP